MHGHNDIASYIPQSDPIISYSETGSIHVQYLDIPKPYDSWLWFETELGGYWDAPVKCPIDSNQYYWDESLLNWVKVEV